MTILKETYRLKKERWQKEVKDLLVKGRSLFRKGCGEKEIDKIPPEDALYQIVDQTASRS